MPFCNQNCSGFCTELKFSHFSFKPQYFKCLQPALVEPFLHFQRYFLLGCLFFVAGLVFFLFCIKAVLLIRP